MKRSITIRDVARQARVSVATVSRVISGSAVVSAETRDKVTSVLDELNFEPNRLGRALARNRHDAFALVLPGLGGALFAGILDGLENALAGTGINFHVLVAPNEEAFPVRFTDLATRVDGMCVFGAFADDHLISTVAERMTIVRIAGNPDPVTHSVDVDNFESARELTAHLIAVHGLRDLLFLGQIARSPDVHQRYRGFQRALADAGVDDREQLVACSLTQAAGLQATSAILGRAERPQALVCATDEVATGALIACAQAGTSVPRDLAVTGFDDVELASLTSPSLTTVDQPFMEIGERAGQILLRHTREGLPEQQPENHRLPARFIIRHSCGC